MLDESRTNDAGNIICATCGIADLNQFLEEYNLEESDLKEHYEGDEDQDWLFPVLDENNNCIVTNDDVGLDGVGPNDINYNGPDEGECNNRPDCIEGIGCEPNFGETDISESDMIGLTSFKLFHPSGANPLENCLAISPVNPLDLRYLIALGELLRLAW